MAMDGELLARARSRLAEIKQNNEAESERRRREIYARLPEVEQIDLRLRRMMTGVVGLALRRGHDVREEINSIAEENLLLQRRRGDLLRSAGYAPDYLDEIYSCPVCSDTGFTKGRMCACLKELYEKEQTRSLSGLMRLGTESFDNFDLTLYDDNAEDPTVGTTPRRWMQRILAYCKNYAQNFSKSSPNLLFTGGTGLGKTFTSACIAREVSGSGVSVVYESVSSVIEPFEIIKFGRAEPESDAWTQRRRILECDLLILDDLGTEMQTAFSASVLYTVVNTRLTNGKCTIISTNLDKNAIRLAYGDQLASRLEGEYVIMPFVGRDIRLTKKSR